MMKPIIAPSTGREINIPTPKPIVVLGMTHTLTAVKILTSKYLQHNFVMTIANAIVVMLATRRFSENFGGQGGCGFF